LPRKGLLFVVSGPSGAGKGTLCQDLLRRRPGLRFSVSVTTRSPRAGEVDGVHYFFWPRERFLEAVDRGYFLEWAEVYGNYYGTPAAEVESALKAGSDILLDLDIQGARQVKEKVPDAVLIFILPPSLDALQERISRRGTETEQERRLRLEAASGFLKAARDFDYIVLNDILEEAGRVLDAIITAERCRTFRQLHLIDDLTTTGPGRGKEE
jgi:guanylate kinase